MGVVPTGVVGVELDGDGDGEFEEGPKEEAVGVVGAEEFVERFEGRRGISGVPGAEPGASCKIRY